MNPGVAYLRWSTDDQALSAAAQRAAIESWAHTHGVTILAWHEDAGVSGGTPLDERPGLMAALDDVSRFKAKSLVVAKGDRLARDVMIAALVSRLVEKAGATIQSADGVGNGTGPEAELFRNILSAFAMFERALIRSRTKAALAVKKARGERVGSIPLGKVLHDGRLVGGPEDAALDRARQLRAAGASMRSIARTLTEEGYPCRGKSWQHSSLGRALA